MTRKKILFVTSRLPYPPIGGEKLKSHWLLKILSKHYDIHLVSLSEKKIPDEFYKWAQEIGITFKIFKKRRVSYFFAGLRSLFNVLPFQVNYFYFKDVQNYISSIYKAFDLIFSVLIRTAKYVMDLEKPKILEMTDAISLNYKKSLQKTTSLKWKLIYKIEYPRLVKFEKKCARVFNKTLLVNKEEAEYLDYDKKIVWLPNGVSERLLTYEKKNPRYKNCICFYGKMNYQPNIDAVMWFVENVLPRLNEEIKFCIVGTNPTNKIKKLEKKYHNVIVTGFVQDPYEILKSCLCVVAPMQTGAGIQNKVLESMALGTVNIVSSLSAKPIGAKSYEHFIIEDNPKKIAEIIHDIYSGSKKYESIKLRSRKYIKNNFTWDIYEDKLIEIIEKLLNK